MPKLRNRNKNDREREDRWISTVIKMYSELAELDINDVAASQKDWTSKREKEGGIGVGFS